MKAKDDDGPKNAPSNAITNTGVVVPLISKDLSNDEGGVVWLG